MSFPSIPEIEATSGRLYLSQGEGEQESNGLKMKLGVIEWSLCESLTENNTYFSVLYLIHLEGNSKITVATVRAFGRKVRCSKHCSKFCQLVCPFLLCTL